MNEDPKDEPKIPTPPVPEKTSLYKSIGFWSTILLTLDKKLQHLSEQYGYGEINLTLAVHRGKVTRIIWNDKIYDNELVSIAGGTNDIVEEGKKKDRENTT